MFIKKLQTYYKDIFILAIPIILGNIAHILIGACDVFVASKHSVDTLAAISIANAVIMCLFIFGIGLLAGVTPIISNYLGAKKSAKKYFLTSLIYSQIIATVFFILTILLLPFVGKFGFETKLVPMIKEYLFIVAFSYFGAYMHFAIKEFLQAFEIINFPNLLSFAAVALNLIFNFAFVFGVGFIPSMGAKGIAVATLLVRTLMGLILYLYAQTKINMKLNYFFKFDYIKQLVKVSMPIAFSMLLEFFAFNIVTLIMGKVSGLYAAAQSLIITITSLTFMVPLAISNVIAIKTGYANGARIYNDIKNYSIAGISVSTIFMGFCSVFLCLSPREILSLVTSDETLLQIAIPIVRVAGLFQIFDGLQVSFGGILKGLKNTRYMTISMIAGYWITGIPSGIFFAFKLHLNLLGFWYGFYLAMLFMILYLGIVLIILFKKLKKLYSD